MPVSIGSPLPAPRSRNSWSVWAESDGAQPRAPPVVPCDQARTRRGVFPLRVSGVSTTPDTAAGMPPAPFET